MVVHCHVLLKSGGLAWIQVEAKDLREAIIVATNRPDVEHVYEVSYVPGGVIT